LKVKGSLERKVNIGELAKRSGLNPSRIRFYEAKGLLNVVTRGANGYRRYPPEALVLLNVIIRAQEVGFSLEEIQRVVPADLAHWRRDKLIQALRQKILDIEVMEEHLAKSKSHLQDLIQRVENKPAGMDCAENAGRVLGEFAGDGAIIRLPLSDKSCKVKSHNKK
jgi:DNA-binding transcriptional MerR regulator